MEKEEEDEETEIGGGRRKTRASLSELVESYLDMKKYCFFFLVVTTILLLEIFRSVDQVFVDRAVHHLLGYLVENVNNSTSSKINF